MTTPLFMDPTVSAKANRLDWLEGIGIGVTIGDGGAIWRKVEEEVWECLYYETEQDLLNMRFWSEGEVWSTEQVQQEGGYFMVMACPRTTRRRAR